MILNTLDKKPITQITIIVPTVRTLPMASFFTQNLVFMEINDDDALAVQVGCNRSVPLLIADTFYLDHCQENASRFSHSHTYQTITDGEDIKLKCIGKLLFI